MEQLKENYQSELVEGTDEHIEFLFNWSSSEVVKLLKQISKNYVHDAVCIETDYRADFKIHSLTSQSLSSLLACL
jgi:hypothetical protein